jgi:hypothetical protein
VGGMKGEGYGMEEKEGEGYGVGGEGNYVLKDVDYKLAVFSRM